jgi:hypothetical protein
LIGVILYNMALMVHIFGTNSNDLSKALAMYNASLESISNRTCDFQPPRLLLMALHNNSAQIHSHNCCMQETGRSLQEVGSLLTRDQQASIKKEDYDIFYLNVELLSERKENSSPAYAA